MFVFMCVYVLVRATVATETAPFDILGVGSRKSGDTAAGKVAGKWACAGGASGSMPASLSSRRDGFMKGETATLKEPLRYSPTV